jgi:hypothetical protein
VSQSPGPHLRAPSRAPLNKATRSWCTHTRSVPPGGERRKKKKEKKDENNKPTTKEEGEEGVVSKVLLSVGSPAAEPRMRKVCLGVSLCLPLLSFHDHRH